MRKVDNEPGVSLQGLTFVWIKLSTFLPESPNEDDRSKYLGPPPEDPFGRVEADL